MNMGLLPLSLSLRIFGAKIFYSPDALTIINAIEAVNDFDFDCYKGSLDLI